MDLKAIADISKLESFKDKDVIVAEEDLKYDKMYILLVGSAYIYKNFRSEENKILLGSIKAGELFGEMSLFANKKRTATIIANGDVTVITITKDNFLNLCIEKPLVVFGLIQTICERLSNLNMDFVELNKERDNLLRQFNVDVDKYKKKILFPNEHSMDNIPMNPNDKKYLINSNFACPICKHKFSTLIPSELKLKYKNDITSDLRKEAFDINILWYELIHCPNCLFTSFYDNFNEKQELYVQKTHTKLKSMQKKLMEAFDFANEKGSDIVFAEYYLGLICADAFINNYQIKAKLWISLSWLYSDLKNETMYEFATKKAFEAYSEFFSNSNLNKRQDQQISLVLATLAFRIKDYNACLRYISRVKLNKEGNHVYVSLAEDLSYALKEMKENKDK